MFGFDRSNKVIGLDIGSSAIKMVELSSTRRGIELSRVGVAPMPPDAMVEGVIVDPAAVGATIAQMADVCQIEAIRTVGAVSGPAVITRQLKLPRMNEPQLRRSIPWEAKRYIASPIEDCVVEFEILHEDPNASEMTVMLVAAPRAAVDSRVMAIEEAGLEPVAVDIGAFALVRSVVEAAPSAEFREQTLALVDIGANYTDFNIVAGGELAFTRSIPMGGNILTNAIRAALNVVPAEAEEAKKRLDAKKMLAQQGRGADPALVATQPILEELVKEIKRTIDYYQSFFEGSTEGVINGLVISGGTARMRNLDLYLENKLQIPVQAAEVFKSRFLNVPQTMSNLLGSDSASLAVAVGLALREIMLARGLETAPRSRKAAIQRR